MRVVNEADIERVVTCINDKCDQYCESLPFHEARHHYERYDFNSENETFSCRDCGSAVNEEFEVVEDGTSTRVEQQWITCE